MPYYTLFDPDTREAFPMVAPNRDVAVIEHGKKLQKALTLEDTGAPPRYMMCERGHDEPVGWIHATIPVYEQQNDP